jgi:hypothetical protein
MRRCFHAGAADEPITRVANASLHRSPIPMSSGSSPFLSVDVFFVHGDGINKKVEGRRARQLYSFKPQARTKDGETRRGKYNEQRPRINALATQRPEYNPSWGIIENSNLNATNEGYQRCVPMSLYFRFCGDTDAWRAVSGSAIRFSIRLTLHFEILHTRRGSKRSAPFGFGSRRGRFL